MNAGPSPTGEPLDRLEQVLANRAIRRVRSVEEDENGFRVELHECAHTYWLTADPKVGHLVCPGCFNHLKWVQEDKRRARRAKRAARARARTMEKKAAAAERITRQQERREQIAAILIIENDRTPRL